MMRVAAEVVEYRVCGDREKGGAPRTDKIKRAVEGKK